MPTTKLARPATTSTAKKSTTGAPARQAAPKAGAKPLAKPVATKATPSAKAAGSATPATKATATRTPATKPAATATATKATANKTPTSKATTGKATTGKATVKKAATPHVAAAKTAATPAARTAGKSPKAVTAAAAGGKPRKISPEQALANTRGLLDAKREQNRQSHSWQSLGPAPAHPGSEGFQSPGAADKAEELHAGESRMSAIEGSISTRGRQSQGKRDHR